MNVKRVLLDSLNSLSEMHPRENTGNRGPWFCKNYQPCKCLQGIRLTNIFCSQMTFFAKINSSQPNSKTLYIQQLGSAIWTLFHYSALFPVRSSTNPGQSHLLSPPHTHPIWPRRFSPSVWPRKSPKKKIKIIVTFPTTILQIPSPNYDRGLLQKSPIYPKI